MEMKPSDAIAACSAAHERLLTALAGIDEPVPRRPSRLPGWSVGHLLTHLARNADGHALRLEGALRGEEVPRYPGGQEQRNREIEEGAGRPAKDLVADVADSAARLQETWNRSERAGWPRSQLLGTDRWPTSGSPLRRLREVEVHHVDLGLGYEATDWPDFYVRWELPLGLEGLPERLSDSDSRRLLAWIIGRSESPEGIELPPWI